MIYKDFTIEEDYRNPYSNKPEFMYFLTDDGIQHDYDLIGEDYKYCGNCKWAASLKEAQAEIDDIVEGWFTDVHRCVDHSALNIANRHWKTLELIAANKIQTP